MALLVAYATDHGSTRGIADRIVYRLQQRGVDAEACAVADVLEVSRYEAVVLGSAIHGGKWLPAARHFAERNATPLRERPVWLFSVSTLGDEDSMFPPRVANRLRALRKETPEVAGMRRRLHPRDHRNFAGAVARSHWPATGRAFFRVLGGRYGDHRNWPAIDAWADLIAAQTHVKSRG
jgi:menaquinone-dependent protoporphyrinogen oxidase